MKFLKLRSKIVAAIFLSCIIIALTYGTIIYVFELYRYENSLNKIKLLVKTTVMYKYEDLANEISYKLIDALDITLKSIMDIKGIVGVSAYDRQGNLICRSGKYNNVLKISSQKQNDVNSFFFIHKTYDKNTILDYTVPIKVVNELAGYIKVSYSLNDVENESYLTFMLFVILIIVTLIVLFIILNFMLSRFVTKPVLILSNAMKKMYGDEIYETIFLNSKDEIGEMAEAFNEMSIRFSATLDELRMAKKEAESANTAKSEFLAKMSHEIRTPLNAITGLTHLAMQTKLTSRQRDYLNKIKSSSQTLLGVINDILDFSKIEAGKMEIESTEFNLEDVLDSLANLVKVEAEEKEIELLFSIDEKVPDSLVGDPLRLGQVLTNLTSNALKFTNSGQIIIKVEKIQLPDLPPDKVKILFSVQDSGIGIAPEKLAILFDAFTQADGSVTRKFGGTGLGLAICKCLTEMMNGEIRVKSSPGKGSNFMFTAEFGQKIVHKDKQFVPPVHLEKTKILVTDDNESSRQILHTMLRSFSFEVYSVSSGIEAIEKLKKASKIKPFDLVCMDWNMPELDGIETIVQILKNPKIYVKPKIIMISGYGEKLIDQTKQVKIDAVLIKPVNRSLLFETIMEVLGSKITNHCSELNIKPQQNNDIPNIKGAKVLLAEDNKINQQVARELLENAGILVHIAENGKQAVNTLKILDFDLILMDIQMPEMDGYEAAEEIRKLKGPDLPIIAMTAHAMSGEKDKCIKSGINDYLSKPIDPDKLFSTLIKWIDSNKLSQNKEKIKINTKHNTEDKSDIITQNLSGIDIESGLKCVGGNYKLYKKILNEFRQDYANISDNCKKLLENKEVDQAVMIIHALKGVSGHIGAKKLYQYAYELEFAIKESHFELSSNLFQNLEKALNEVLTSIGNLNISKKKLKQNKAEPIKAKSISQFNLYINKLIFLLTEGDSSTLEYFESIKQYLDAYFSEDQIYLLEEQINNYDFDQAVYELMKIKKYIDTK